FPEQDVEVGWRAGTQTGIEAVCLALDLPDQLQGRGPMWRSTWARSRGLMTTSCDCTSPEGKNHKGERSRLGVTVSSFPAPPWPDRGQETILLVGATTGSGGTS